MLVPVLLPPGAGEGTHAHHAGMATGSMPVTLAAIGVHTLAMLAVIGAIAVLVHEWPGPAFLRRGWINFVLLWIGAVVIAGLLLILV